MCHRWAADFPGRARAISADDEPFAAEVQGLRGPRRVRAYLVDVTRRERLAA